MAVFPEFLYTLSQRDEQITALEIVSARSNTFSGAATALQTLSGIYTVPNDRVLSLSSMVIQGQAGAGQVFQNAIGFILLPNAASTQFQYLGTQKPNTTPGQNGFIQALDNTVLIGPGCRIFAQAVFDLGTVSNSVTYFIQGILFPRGNFAV